MRWLKSLLSVGIFAVLAHIVWSAIVVSLLMQFCGHRLPDLTKIKNIGNEWEDFSAAFIGHALAQAKSEKNSSAIFVGSSVTHGYPWQESVIFTRVAQRHLPGWNVANLSVIGLGMSGVTDFITCALTGPSKPAVLVVEIPLVNSLSEIKPGYIYSSRKCRNYSAGLPGYWPFVLSRPYGAAWFSFLYDEESYDKPEENFVPSKIPSTYFASVKRFETIRAPYEVAVTEYLNTVAGMGGKVFAYVSPVYVAGIDAAGGEGMAVAQQIQLTAMLCQKNGKVICLDASSFNANRDYFYNLTHFNQRGHRAFGEWIARQIAGSKALGG